MGEIAIVGAGLLGRLTAWRLLQADYRVSLFDRDGRDGKNSCTYVGAGMLAPFAELEKAEPVISQIGLASLDLWAKWLPQLPRPVFFQRNGSLVVAHRQDQADLTTFMDRVASKLSEPNVMQALDRRGIASLEPELAERFFGGCFFPDEGQLDPRELLIALQNALDEYEVDWYQHTDVVNLGPGFVLTKAGIKRFDLVIDTRGLGAAADLPELRGVRGELIRVHAPEVRLNRPIRLMHPRYPLYISPRADDHYLIGATSIESDDNGAITVRSALELLSAAYSLHPGFAEARLLECATACRPALPDNLPRIISERGLIRANGLYRHGYLVGPVMAEEILAQISREDSRFDTLVEIKHART